MTAVLPEPTPEVTLVFVNWNTREHLRAALRSVASAAAGLRCEVIVVDNASDDGSDEMVRTEYPEVTLLQNSTNLGFGKATDLAFRHARGEFLASVNPDLSLQPSSLAGMVEFLRQNPRVGLVGPLLQDLRGQVTSAAETLPGVMSAFAYFPGFARVYRSRIHRRKAYQIPRRCGWLRGSCLVLRRSAVDSIGGFPTVTFMYGEEMLLGYALSSTDWEVWYLPQFSAIHHGGASARQRWNAVERAVLVRQARIVVMRRLLSPWRFRLWNALMLAGIKLQWSAAGILAAPQDPDYLPRLRALHREAKRTPEPRSPAEENG